MEETQSFRLVETTDTVKITINHVEGQDMVHWEDIEQAFPGAKRVRNGTSVINFTRSSGPQSPSLILDVVWTAVVKPTPTNSSGVDTMDCDENLRTDASDTLDALKVAQPSKARLLQQIASHASRKAHESEVEQRFISLLPPEVQETVRSSSDIYQAFSKAISDGDGEMSRAELRQDRRFQKLEAMVTKNTELQEALFAKQEEARRLQEEANRLQEQVLRNQEEMKQMQQQTLNQLAVLQSRVQAVLTQTYELHEYPIPRLFVILPQDPSRWDSVNVFANKFRLYFLCECGEHTMSINSTTRIPHHIHLAKHEGYEIARPSEFFQQYGAYILTILKMLKYGVTIAGVIMPTFSQLISPEVLGQTIHGLKILQDTIVPGVDQVVNWIENDENVNEVTGQVETKEALEGADLRKLDTFLKDKDGSKVLGNLYRTVTDEGHVKWVCIDHYRMNYQENAAKEFQRVLEAVGGTFSENLGRISVEFRSKTLAQQFFSVLAKARSVYELDVGFDWAFTTNDLELLEGALRTSTVAILRLDLRSIRVGIASKLLSTSSQYDVIFRIKDIPNLKLLHVVLSKESAKFLALPPKKSTSACKMTCELGFGESKDFGVLIESLKTTSTLVTLDLQQNLIEGDRAKALAEAIKINSTLSTLDLGSNLIGVDGAKALAEALKTNTTLITLDLESNSIGGDGAKALADVLKINSTLVTLVLGNNSIRGDGAKALAEALKVNSILTMLKLWSNSIRDDGAKALAEALKINSTLVSLDLGSNSIGGDGVKALAEALKINSTLLTLDLWKNSIGDQRAKVLAEALKINSTLTTLNLWSNSIGGDGAKALAEALKINSTLDTLNLRNNSIGGDGAKALAEALKINSTLITLDLERNSIGGDGAKELAEALKINSTLINLHLGSNSIGGDGVEALAGALRINSTLTTLNLWSNSIGDDGAKALAEALTSRSTLITLHLMKNLIGDEGATALAQARKTNSAITILGIIRPL
ncbi:hypothetical protein EC968_002984 [Mortierella alpina]|nr:hypothetical protein EC968_002984 [Mortierella alpina]